MGPKRLRLKVIDLEALQFDGNFEEVERFAGGDAEYRNGQTVVAGPQGPLWLSRGFWIVRTAGGEYFICSPETLAAIAEDPPTPKEN